MAVPPPAPPAAAAESPHQDRGRPAPPGHWRGLPPGRWLGPAQCQPRRAPARTPALPPRAAPGLVARRRSWGEPSRVGRRTPARAPFPDLAPPLLFLPLVSCSAVGHGCALLSEGLHHGRQEREPPDGHVHGGSSMAERPPLQSVESSKSSF